ncbi:MAG: winged helix-turn-helix domain-containing protein [candidate division WOR-3 bacterium]
MRNGFLRRNNLDVMYEILSFCRKERQKTRIMYKCNLSYELLKKYIGFLVSRDLLEKSRDKYYRTTMQGLDFLNEYERVRNMLNKRYSLH